MDSQWSSVLDHLKGNLNDFEETVVPVTDSPLFGVTVEASFTLKSKLLFRLFSLCFEFEQQVNHIVPYKNYNITINEIV